LIDEMLRADLDAPRKQRHTVKRIFERLLDEHGANEISYQMVRGYVAGRREEIRGQAGRGVVEAFVPQTHKLGAEAEVVCRAGCPGAGRAPPQPGSPRRTTFRRSQPSQKSRWTSGG
jgi:hypothetical protein